MRDVQAGGDVTVAGSGGIEIKNLQAAGEITIIGAREEEGNGGTAKEIGGERVTTNAGVAQSLGGGREKEEEANGAENKEA